MENEPAVLIRDLDFSYNGELVLEAVNLTIDRGEFVGVVGPNGGGKTTLLKLMLGLLRPTRGWVEVFGQRPERVRRRLGYVPQSFQFDPRFPVTVLDVVIMGRLGAGPVLGPYSREDRERASWALEQVGLADMRRLAFSSLSAGQRQRALVARALTCGAEMLLLDEPTANADVAAEREINDLLESLNATMTIVMVSHDLSVVSRLVQSVICVNRRVTRHPTCEISDATGELLGALYGRDMRLVRHDRTCLEGDPQCLASGPH